MLHNVGSLTLTHEERAVVLVEKFEKEEQINGEKRHTKTHIWREINFEKYTGTKMSHNVQKIQKNFLMFFITFRTQFLKQSYTQPPEPTKFFGNRKCFQNAPK